MPSLHMNITGIFPIISIRIRQRQGDGYVVTEDLAACVDTGANTTYVVPDTFSQYGLNVARLGQVQTGSTAGGPIPECDVEMAVMGTGEEPDWIPLSVCEARHIPFDGCQAAVGWSFLKRCVFLFDGIQEKFSLTWSRNA